MAISVATQATLRYGYGFRPDQAAPDSAEALLDGLGAAAPAGLPAIPELEEIFALFQRVRTANRAMLDGARNAEDLRKRSRQALRAAREPLLARRLLSP
ncbi:MAG: hypothetical protein AAGE13_14155, partial [Pseudomonadota bacterium]